MDLFGHWEVKDEVIQTGPKHLREMWGITYTCMATRTLYLDINEGL